MCKSNCNHAPSGETVTITLARYNELLNAGQTAGQRATMYARVATERLARLNALRAEVAAIADKCAPTDEARAYIGGLLRAAIINSGC